MTFSRTNERTYPKLLARLGKRRSVWAECVFVDPVSDVAVLAAPDGQELPKEREEYQSLVEQAVALCIGEIPEDALKWPPVEGTLVCVMTLEGEIARGAILRGRHFIYSDEIRGHIKPGMSGSPIVSEGGAAIGVVTSGFLDPALAQVLPGWLLSELRRDVAATGAGDLAEASLP